MEADEIRGASNRDAPNVTARSSIRELAAILYESKEPVDIYLLHARYQLGAAEILKAVRLFTRLRLIRQLDDGFIELTEGARERIWRLRYRLLLSGQRPWAAASLERADPSAPYLPDLSKVDRAFFYAKVADPRKGS